MIVLFAGTIRGTGTFPYISPQVDRNRLPTCGGDSEVPGGPSLDLFLALIAASLAWLIALLAFLAICLFFAIASECLLGRKRQELPNEHQRPSRSMEVVQLYM